MQFFLLSLAVAFEVATSYIIGNCNTDVGPPSWLKTAGHGLTNWGTAGVNLGGNSFCLEGNKTAEIVEVAYHINLTCTKAVERRRRVTLDTSGNQTNGCLNQDPRIHYCVPFCFDDRLQLGMIDAALKSNANPSFAAILAQANYNSPLPWAFTVITVDYTNPETHLVIDSFPDPAWCSVYVGMQTNGDPYLYEMQAGLVLQ